MTAGVALLSLLLGAAGDVRLPAAAQADDLAAVRALLAERLDGVDVNEAQGDGMTALHWAAFHDDVEMARVLLGASAGVESSTRVGGITPLVLASRNGSAPMIRTLLEARADPNHATDTGATPLMSAAMSGNVEAVTLLVDSGADVNAREEARAQTPLMFAAWENRPEVIARLVERGAHLELTSSVLLLEEPRLDEQGNPLPRRGGREQSGASSAMGGMTALLYAARDGHLEAVRALVEAGSDVNHASGGDGSSPLVIAIANGHYAVGQYLLDHGADPNRANLDGLAALFATVNMRYAPVSWAPNPRTDQEAVDSLDLLRALLEAGADPNARILRKLWFSPTSHDRGWVDHSGATPFWRAAMSSDIDAMRVLVAGGANPNLATETGTTPLMVAAGLGWIGNFNQNAPGGWMEAVRYCIELGNDVNAIDADGMTALHGAASRGDNEMARYLVDQGARVDVFNREGNSPADMAFGPSRFFIPRPDTAELLVALGSPFQNNCRSDQCVDGKFLPTPAAK